MKHILSYGAGLNSTTLLVYMVENKMPLDLVMFADTGDENPETYEMLDFYKKWCPVEFVTVKSPLGKIYDYYYDKKVVPNRLKRDCTDKFKVTPMRNYIKKRWGRKEGYTFYIGIDYSEAHRMRTPDVKWITEQKYPLVDAKIDRDACERFLHERYLPIPPKSGCWFCPFNRKGTWLDMMKDKPKLYDKAAALETNCRVYPKSASLLNSVPLIELKKRHDPQTRLTDFESSCDVVGSCFL